MQRISLIKSAQNTAEFPRPEYRVQNNVKSVCSSDLVRIGVFFPLPSLGAGGRPRAR
jgi:hypothetical protein